MSEQLDIETTSKELRDLLTRDESSLERIAKSIIKTCDKLEESWSGSWIGYHANLYYGEYETPPSNEMFSIEWGGLNGISPAWKSRSLEEVWKLIAEKSPEKFDLDTINDKIIEIQESAASLKTLYELNEANPVLANKIKDINTDFTIQSYIKARGPGTIVSRDSEAVYQGMKLPPHIQCAGFAHTIRQNITAANQLLKLKPLVLGAGGASVSVQLLDNELSHLNPKLVEKAGKLYADKHYAEAVGVGFKIVKDRLRDITGYENGFPAFIEGGLYIKGAAADNVDDDFQEAVKRLLGAIDKFRNEKFHTSEANLKDAERALGYLHMCSLALSFLTDERYSIKPKKKPAPASTPK